MTDPARSATSANPTAEQARLQLQHALAKTAQGDRLVFAPVDLSYSSTDPPALVLDSATADGYWLLDAAVELPPYATLVGADVDISNFPYTPSSITSLVDHISNQHTGGPQESSSSNSTSSSQYAATPQRQAITFIQHSAVDPWPAEIRSSFSLVHQRYVLAVFSPQVSQTVVRNLVSLVRPGDGWVQLVEGEPTGFDIGQGNDAFRRFRSFVMKAFREQNMNPHPAEGLKTWLEHAGCVDVEERRFAYKIGKGAEGGEDGQRKTSYSILAILDNMAAVGKKDFALLRADLESELAAVGNVFRFRVAWGRRPSQGL